MIGQTALWDGTDIQSEGSACDLYDMLFRNASMSTMSQ